MKSLKYLPILAVALSSQVYSTDFTTLSVGTAGSDTLVFNSSLMNSYNGSAVFVLNPYFTDANQRSVGMFCNPTISRISTVASPPYLACFNLKMGDPTHPIPPGTIAVPTGYQANIDTNQSESDYLGAYDGAMGYGSTITTRNGAPFVSNAAAINILNVPANGYGFDLGIVKNVNGGVQYGYNAASQGTYAPDTAFRVDGAWLRGLDLGGNGIYAATNIFFAAPATGPAGGSITNLDYSIVGSLPDTLRITGGGTAHGMIIQGSPRTGEGGLIRFRNNPVQAIQTVSIDTSTGNITSAGNLAAKNLILTAPNGSCWKLSVASTGALSTASVTCPTP